jgi:hypothetical protein
MKRGLPIHASAEGSFTLFAILAVAITYIEWQDYPIPFPHSGDTGPGFDYDSHILMASISTISMVPCI